jgi:sterol desaturase/sphingolipid hydroxylase (fatty acid hydroxylase superfamily)
VNDAQVLATLIAWKLWLVSGWMLAFFVLERGHPRSPWHWVRASRRWLGDVRRLGRHLALLAINSLLSPLIVLPVTVAAASWWQWRPELWPAGVSGLLIDIILLDCWLYWWHRANHEIPFLWRFHRAHHLDQQLDATSAVRFHPGEVILSALARVIVILALDIPLTSVLVYEVIILLAASFHHSNIRIPSKMEQWLARLIITPGIHWVHHHAVRADTDSNYGTLFSFWDRLFGSLSPTRRWSAMPLGTAGLSEQNLGRLLLSPILAERALSRVSASRVQED